MIVELMIFVGILIVYFWFESRPFYWRGKGINWMIPWPIIGNAGGSLVKSYYDFWLEFYKKVDGNMVGFHLLRSPALLLKDPELIKQVMISDADSYMSHGFYTSDSDMFKPNLFHAEEKQWQETRARLSPFFTPSKIKNMVPLIDMSLDSYVHELESESKKGSVEIDDVSLKLSTDTIVTVVLGMKPDSFTNPDSFFFQLQKELPGFSFGLRILLGFLSHNLYNALGLTVFRKISYEKITFFVKQVLESRITGQENKKDFMQGMTTLYNQHMKDEIALPSHKLLEKTAVFDLRGVSAQTLVLFMAGTDTVGHSIAFVFYELARRQDLQEKLRKEIFGAISDNNKMGYEEMKNLKYLDMVVSESLRMHPVATIVMRKCTRKTRLSNVELQVGTLLVILIVAIHKDEKYYPDPYKFDPERFTANVERGTGTYIPFGLGPRRCIGARLAEILIKQTLCRVLSEYNVNICSETPKVLKAGYGLTMGPRNGIHLCFNKLKS